MPNLSWDQGHILYFVLIFLRISTFLFVWPVFSVFSVPSYAKILLGLLFCMLLFPIVKKPPFEGELLSGDIVFFTLKEVFVGVAIGFSTRMFFFVVSVAGNLISTSLGMASAHMFNPTLAMETTTLEQFYMTLGTLLFLSLNGHHILLRVLVESFDYIPLLFKFENFDMMRSFVTFINTVIVAGLQIAAPIILAVFIMNIAMGAIGRAVPQINVLVTSLPVNVLVGFAVLVVTMPLILAQMDHLMLSLSEDIFLFMRKF